MLSLRQQAFSRRFPSENKEIHELTHPIARNEEGKAKKVADELNNEVDDARNSDDTEDHGQVLAAVAVTFLLFSCFFCRHDGEKLEWELKYSSTLDLIL
ncbi:MAG: hypothetical protein HQL32_01900 [Planctomycetes bacterium]|nr:hypothetical protein [Planctomycetota bacterium]